MPKEGWQEDSNGWWYIDEYGEYPRDCVRYIHGKNYLFDKNGYLTSGWHYNMDIIDGIMWEIMESWLKVGKR